MAPSPDGGAVAQMGERCNRTAEVRGSIPLGSTTQSSSLPLFCPVRWKTNQSGMRRLILANRLEPGGNTLNYVRFIDDFPAMPLTNVWSDVGSSVGGDKIYVVQTGPKIIQRPPHLCRGWQGDKSLPGVKELVSLRIDRDVLDFFQEAGPGWQDRINAALRKAAGR